MNLPKASRYDHSYMHKDTLSHIFKASKYEFVITISVDGIIKFWNRIQKNKAGNIASFDSLNTTTDGSSKHKMDDEDEGILSFIRQYKAHTGPIALASISLDERWLVTIGTEDKIMRFWDVPNFDMANFRTLQSVPTTLEWIDDATDPRVLIAFGNTIQVHGMESLLNTFYLLNDHSISNENPEESFIPIKHLKFHPPSHQVLIFENQASVQWNFPETGPTIVIPFKQEIDISSSTWSPSFDILAACCKDKQLRLFKDGRLWKRFDESREFYQSTFEKGHFFPSRYKHVADQAEFDRRLQVDVLDWNAVFDETGHYILFASPIGIKIVDIEGNKLVGLIGWEDNIRYTYITLDQSMISKLTLEMAASENPLATSIQTDPLIFAIAYKKARFYVLSNRQPSLTTRDILNERSIQPKKVHRTDIPLTLNPDKPIVATIRSSFGDIVIDLFPKEAPMACENFVTLAKRGYYNNCIFHRIIKAFMIQTGDPTGTGCGGESAWKRPFPDELSPTLTHNQPLTVSMANSGPNTNGSQFFITTIKCSWLDQKHTIFGRVKEGTDVVHRIEHVSTGKQDRPLGDTPPKIVQIDIQIGESI